MVDERTGAEVVAQVTRGELDSLHLLEGDRVVARATRVPDVSLAPAAETAGKTTSPVAVGARSGDVALA